MGRTVDIIQSGTVVDSIDHGEMLIVTQGNRVSLRVTEIGFDLIPYDSSNSYPDHAKTTTFSARDRRTIAVIDGIVYRIKK